MKNIIIIVADSLRLDTFKEIVVFPESLPMKEYNVKACNSCTDLSLPWMLSGMELFSPGMSIPSDLKKKGYHTVLIHSNPVVDRFKGPFDQTIDLGHKSDSYKKLKRFNRLTRYLPNSIYSYLRSKQKNYLPYARITENLETMNRVESTKPLFVWLHLMDPHTPYYPPMTDTSLNKIIESNRNQMSAVRGYYTPKEEEVKEWYELYRLESAWMFWNLITYLKTVDYTRNTVIFTSDHGEEFGEHGEYGHKGNRFNPENVEVPFLVFGDGVGNLPISNHSGLRSLIKCC